MDLNSVNNQRKSKNFMVILGSRNNLFQATDNDYSKQKEVYEAPFDESKPVKPQSPEEIEVKIENEIEKKKPKGRK